MVERIINLNSSQKSRLKKRDGEKPKSKLRKKYNKA